MERRVMSRWDRQDWRQVACAGRQPAAWARTTWTGRPVPSRVLRPGRAPGFDRDRRHADRPPYGETAAHCGLLAQLDREAVQTAKLGGAMPPKRS